MSPRWTPLAVTLLLGAAPAAAQPALPPLPPLQQPPSGEHHPGKVIANLLATPDLAGSEQFYGGLFGWTFQTISLGRTSFAQASAAGQPVAGLVERPMPAGARRQPAWLGLISTPDAAALSTSATQHGATLLFGPRDIPGLGQEAILSDPQGAVFGALASSSGDPADKLAPPETWIWHAVFARDPDAEAAFYQTLFNYDVYSMPGAGEAQRLILATEDFARASANPLPPGQAGEPARWLSFVRVPDAAAAAAKAASLGGRVVVSPRMDRHGAQIAVLADPMGAVFGVMEWPEQDAGAAK